jgi:hypothetical protein
VAESRYTPAGAKAERSMTAASPAPAIDAIVIFFAIDRSH